MFLYIALPIFFGAGWLVGRRPSSVAVADSGNEPSSEVDSGRSLEDARGCADNKIEQDLLATRNALADLLCSLEDCEAKLGDNTEAGNLRSDLHELGAATRSVQEMLAVSYDHLRQVHIGPMSVVGRDQLHDWLTRRLALLNRYGNSFSLAVIRFTGRSDGDPLPADQEHDMAQILSNFVRDTDRLFGYSENEFIVALPETLMEDACHFAVRCRETMCQEFYLDARLGVTEAFADDNGRTVLNRADAALHHSLVDSNQPLFCHDGSVLRRISEESASERLARC